MNERIRQTLDVAMLLLNKPKTRRVTLIAAIAYLVIFLLATGDLGIHSPTGLWDVRLIRAPWELMFKQTSPFRFEGIAIVQASTITYLFSPLNLLIALVLSFLVGLNIAFTYLAIVAPKVCYGQPAAGIFSALPGLLAGWACCGPIILIVLGVQASASLIAFFGWLLPIAAALLIGTLVFNGGRTNIGYLEQM